MQVYCPVIVSDRSPYMHFHPSYFDCKIPLIWLEWFQIAEEEYTRTLRAYELKSKAYDDWLASQQATQGTRVCRPVGNDTVNPGQASTSTAAGITQTEVVNNLTTTTTKDGKRVRNTKAAKAPKAPKKPTMPLRRMREGEDETVLLLASAIKVLFARSLRKEAVEPALRRYEEYLKRLSQVCYKIMFSISCMLTVLFDFELLDTHPNIIKPNHHYILHIGEQLFDYGSAYNTWTFWNERLNKVLKTIKTNNRSGGEAECTLFREFERNRQLITQVCLFS